MKRAASATGFTLLELVAVLLLLALLAVTVSSRWQGSADISVQQQRDQLLTMLRRVQLQSMHDSAGLAVRCPTLQLTATLAMLTPPSACAASYPVPTQPDATTQLALTNSNPVTNFGALPQLIRFNAMGEPLLSCPQGICQINVSAAGLTVAVCLHQSGYLQPC